MTNKEIMADSLRLFKALREALGKARTELKKKALAEMTQDTSSTALDKFYGHDKDLSQLNSGLEVQILTLYKVSDDGTSWMDYNEEGERKR